MRSDYDEVDIALENIINSMILEDSDPTIASSSNSSSSSSSSSNTSNDNGKEKKYGAVNELSKMYDDTQKYYENAEKGYKSGDKKDDEESKDEEGKTNKDKKDEKEFSDWLNELLKILTTIISKGFTNLRAGTGNMLEDSKKIRETIANLKKQGNYDDNVVVETFEYDDGYLDKFSSALNESFATFGNSLNGFRDLVNRCQKDKEDSEAQMENKKEKVAKLKEEFDAIRAKGLEDKDFKTENANDEKAMSDPVVYIARKLNITDDDLIQRSKKPEEAKTKDGSSKYNTTISKLENCIEYHYRGDRETGERIVIRSNPEVLKQSEQFLNSSESRIRAIHEEIDRMQTVTNTYKGICNEIQKNLGTMYPGVQGDIRKVVDMYSKNINNYMSLIKFKQTLIYNRFFVCETIIKRVYHAEDAKKTRTK